MKFAAILAFALAAPHATIDAAGLGQARPVADAGQVQVAADAGQTPAAECASKVYCMDGNAYTDDTFGTQIGGTTCSAACGDNCCIERNACARGRFTVCADPGDGSCNGVGGEPVIVSRFFSGLLVLCPLIRPSLFIAVLLQHVIMSVVVVGRPG